MSVSQELLPRFVEVKPVRCVYGVRLAGGFIVRVGAETPEEAAVAADRYAARLNWFATYGDRRLWPLFGCIDE